MLKKSGQAVVSLLALLGAVYCVFDLPTKARGVFNFSTTVQYWSAAAIAVTIVATFLSGLFWYGIKPELRDEPLEKFSEHALALRRIAEMAVPNFPVRTRSIVTMAIGLSTKIIIVNYTIQQLNQYASVGLRTLAEEVERACTPQGVRGLSEWLARFNQDMHAFREFVGPWLRHIEPLLRTPVLVDIQYVEALLLTISRDLPKIADEWPKRNQKQDDAQRRVRKHAEDLISAASVFAARASGLRADLSECQKLISLLRR